MASMTEEIPGGIAAVLENLSEAVLVVDPLGTVVLRNRAGREITGARNESLENVWDNSNVKLWYTDGRPVPREDYPARRLLRGLPVAEQEYLMERRDGRRLWVTVSGATIERDGVPRLAIVAYRDITEFHKVQEARDDYLRAVSHDLRSPLNIISAQAQLLMRSLQDSPMAAEMRRASDILRTAGRMGLMIDDLAESQRLESGAFELHKQPADVAAIVQDVTERMQVLGASPVDLDLPPASQMAPVDSPRLERCIQNLLSNALRYSPPSTRVGVRVYAEDGLVNVEVQDSGPGITEEDLPFIFQRFYRGQAGAGIEGLGLGLYVSRLIAEAHGGTIRVRSVPGQGSTFTLAVPAR